MVLNDQASVLRQFDNVATKVTGLEFANDKTVLDSHLYRIAKMDQLAAKTYETVRPFLYLSELYLPSS